MRKISHRIRSVEQTPQIYACRSGMAKKKCTPARNRSAEQKAKGHFQTICSFSIQPDYEKLSCKKDLSSGLRTIIARQFPAFHNSFFCLQQPKKFCLLLIRGLLLFDALILNQTGNLRLLGFSRFSTQHLKVIHKYFGDALFFAGCVGVFP